MMVIYLDVLIIANFIISYFLLLATAILSGYTYKRKKIILSALLGAFASVIIFFDIKSLALNFLLKFLILLCCILVAFGYSNIKKLISQTTCYIFFNMLLTGMAIYASQKTDVIYEKNTVLYFNINPIALVIFSLVIYGVITIYQLFKEKISAFQTIEISLSVEKDAVITLKAFYDTGFTVKDIINNKDIILVDYNKVKKSLSESLQAVVEGYFENGITQGDKRITPVFFNTITGEGTVPGVKAIEVKYKNKKLENILMAFSQVPLAENVEAIFGNDINKQL